MAGIFLLSFLLPLFISKYSIASAFPRSSSSAENLNILAGVDHRRKNNQYRWSDACEGARPSPIDLRPENAYLVKYEDIIFGNYKLEGPVIVRNDGYTSTVEGFLTWKNAPTIAGGNLKSTYVLRKVEFRWTNDHTFKGVDYPAEVHLVHFSEQYDPGRKEDISGNIAVIAVPIITGKNEADVKDLESLYKADDAEKQSFMPYLGLTDFTFFSPHVLLPRDTSTYYRYTGPLSTPPCAQNGVIWTVMQKPIVLSAEQLNALKNAHLHTKPVTMHEARRNQTVKGIKLYFNRKVKNRTTVQRSPLHTWSGPLNIVLGILALCLLGPFVFGLVYVVLYPCIAGIHDLLTRPPNRRKKSSTIEYIMAGARWETEPLWTNYAAQPEQPVN